MSSTERGQREQNKSAAFHCGEHRGKVAANTKKSVGFKMVFPPGGHINTGKKWGWMRGSIVYQVHRLWQNVNEIGTSKHEAKAVARANGARTWHDIGKSMGVKSHGTADAYRSVWREILRHAKAERGLKDSELLSGEDVRKYLVEKIEDGVAHATISKYFAASEKLELALNREAQKKGAERKYDFSADLKMVRQEAKDLARFEGSRAYVAPELLVSAVHGEQYNLAASMQREGGARVSEVNHLTKDHLRGLQPDSQTGAAKGWAYIKGKGGKKRDIGFSGETYARLEKAVEIGRFEFDKNAYRQELKAAAERTGQKYEGSHGLRWSWAQERHQELQQHGLSYEQALSQISQEMGHERSDITEHYLR